MKYLRAFLSSMTARLFFLLLVGMGVAALIASSISNINNRHDLERQAEERTADRLQQFTFFLDAIPKELRERILDENWSGVLNHDLATPGIAPDPAFSRVLVARGGVLASARAEKAAQDACTPSTRYPRRPPRRSFQQPWPTPPDMPRNAAPPAPQNPAPIAPQNAAPTAPRNPPPSAPQDAPQSRPQDVRDRRDLRDLRDLRDRRDMRDMSPFSGAEDASFGPPACRLVSVTLGDGTPLRLGIETRWIQPAPSRLLDPAFVTLLGMGIVVLAYTAALLASSPLRRLALASTQLGQDLHREPLAMTGPSEVRQAVAAFNSMQARLQSYLAERTQMLAAITHDLQTPLTRLRLRLERVKDQELRDRLIADLQAMRALIDEGLELARTAETPESVVMLDLDSVLESLVEDAVEAGLNAEFQGGCGAVLPLRPLATRRIFANLIDNALVHGGSAAVRAVRDADSIRVFVSDQGPGIPEEFLERVFDPFFRTEESRSRETGGTGLGLTIARMLATKIGASLTLRNHPDGGLEAEVRWLTPESGPAR